MLQALRQSGADALTDVAAVVLETNGSFTVLRRARAEAPALVEPEQPA